MRARTLRLVKRKKYRTSNIVSLDMVEPRTAEEISTSLSRYLDGITPSIVKRLWKEGEMSVGSANNNRSCYLFADDYVEDLMRKEDEKKKRRKELEKKHGRF